MASFRELFNKLGTVQNHTKQYEDLKNQKFTLEKYPTLLWYAMRSGFDASEGSIEGKIKTKHNNEEEDFHKDLSKTRSVSRTTSAYNQQQMLQPKSFSSRNEFLSFTKEVQEYKEKKQERLKQLEEQIANLPAEVKTGVGQTLFNWASHKNIGKRILGNTFASLSTTENLSKYSEVLEKSNNNTDRESLLKEKNILENSLSEEKFESYLSTYKNSINTLISIADYDFAKADQDLAKNAKQLKEIEEKITLEEKDKEKEGHEERIAKLKEEKTQLEEAKNKIEETQKQIKEAKSTLEKDKTKNLNDFKEDIKNAKGGSPISGNFKFEEMLDFALEKAANSNQTEGLKERCNILQAKKGMLEKISHNTNQINGSSSFFGNTWNAVKRLNEGQPLTLNKKEKVELQLQTLALACDTLHPNRPDDEIIADIAKFAQEYPGQGFEKLTSRDDWQTKEGAHIFNTYKALKLKDEMEESKKKEPDTNSKNTTTLELNPDLNPDISTPNPEQNSKQNPEPVSSTTWASKLSQESQPEVNQR